MGRHFDNLRDRGYLESHGGNRTYRLRTTIYGTAKSPLRNSCRSF